MVIARESGQQPAMTASYVCGLCYLQIGAEAGVLIFQWRIIHKAQNVGPEIDLTAYQRFTTSQILPPQLSPHP